MSKAGNQRKHVILGMNHGTASNRLRKKILFSLIVELKKNFCFQCGGEILSESDMSIEHKEAWMQAEDPKKAFFDLKNIAFSHLSCNIAAGTKPNRKFFTAEENRIGTNKRNKKFKNSLGVEKRKEIRRAQYLRTGK